MNKPLPPPQQRVINYLKSTKGWTNIFWVTENQSRATAVTRLEKKGILVRDRDKEGGFPTMYFEIKEIEDGNERVFSSDSI